MHSEVKDGLESKFITIDLDQNIDDKTSSIPQTPLDRSQTTDSKEGFEFDG